MEDTVYEGKWQTGPHPQQEQEQLSQFLDLHSAGLKKMLSAAQCIVFFFFLLLQTVVLPFYQIPLSGFGMARALLKKRGGWVNDPMPGVIFSPEQVL